MSVIESQKRIAIVLFNLGGPDSLEAVQPFLFNLFNDRAILPLPGALRYPLAKFIAWRRAKIARQIYREMGGRSPLFEQTRRQAEALQERLRDMNPQVDVFISMRYWHPMSKEVIERLKLYQPEHIILLPLYPQYSTTTSGSSFEDWRRRAIDQRLIVPTTRICCYPAEQDFIIAHAKQLKEKYFEIAGDAKPRILFSAHGLPEKIIVKGDPYQWQVEQTTARIVKLLSIDGLDYQICYQSRVGPVKWIGPATEEEIKRAGEDKVPVILVPVAFVSEHSETLVELDIEYKRLAESVGVTEYARMPALSWNEHFIEALANLCLSVQAEDTVISFQRNRYCDADWKQCPCKTANGQAIPMGLKKAA